MIHYKIGYNFDETLIKVINDLNSRSEGAIIDSVYGSVSVLDRYTVRPKHRLPDIAMNTLGLHIQKLHESNIRFSYALNATYIGSKAEIYDKQKLLLSEIERLIDNGIDDVIVSHPYIAMLIRNRYNIPIAISSATNIFSVNQMQYLHDEFGCRSFCLAPSFNRKIRMLEKMQVCLNSLQSHIELIVNELCCLGFNNGKSVAPCIFRESCFDCHSENKTQNNDDLLEGYPQRICTGSRDRMQSASWAKAPVIRPEDIKKYSSIGIHYFKITGRTADTDALTAVLKGYMNFDYTGSVSHLWYMKGNTLGIDNKKLDGFLNHWFEDRDHDCDSELCGTTCKYCDDFFRGFMSSCG